MTGDARRPDAAEDEFAAFVVTHGRGLDRLAYFLVGDAQAAEDLNADVMLAMWTQWHQVRLAEHPLAYVRRAMVIQAAKRYRRAARERLGMLRLQSLRPSAASDPDGDDVVDVRSVLEKLPPRRRACLVLRFGFDLSEREVAATLGISVGTVKSQTSKAVHQFRQVFGEPPAQRSNGPGAWETRSHAH